MSNYETRKKILFFSFIFHSLVGSSQIDTSMVRFVDPSSVVQTKGYSQAIVIDLGTCKMLMIAGQVPLDNKGNLVGRNDLRKQTEQVFFNIKNIVSALGGTMDNVVKLGIFMRDISQIQTFRNVRDQFINSNHPPASTIVQVSSLFREDVLLEVEATAILPKTN